MSQHVRRSQHRNYLEVRIFQLDRIAADLS